MIRNKLFSFRMNKEERKLLRMVAEKLKRTQSDTLRFLIRKASQLEREEK